uniref:Mucin-2-like n=1 Tax=Scophthalmus maximus TaxID=52904 RepID=A0A8D3D3I4_SCOMX
MFFSVRNHVSSICSTWGREHFKTFDGDVYQFPAMCEYNLASDCHESYQEFSVHMRRREQDGNPTVSYVVVTINDLSFILSKSLVTVNDLPIKMPYYNAGVQVERNAVYIKLHSKVGITVMWNGDDAVMVELDREYANRTCGLCGDFNGVSVLNEFIHDGRKISPIEFGNKQKVHRPDEDLTCGIFNTESPLLSLLPFYDFCVCSTLSEFSRQCSHAGGQPPNWRKPQFCAKQCPFNMVYEESGSPCMDTCTHRDTSSLCEDHKMDGCFCPHGTVLDDISKRGCIVQSECQCKHVKVYNSGDVYRQDRAECTCLEGRWACKSLNTPATCSIEEGSHVTTFDGKSFTFHGDCYYTLAKVESKVTGCFVQLNARKKYNKWINIGKLVYCFLFFLFKGNIHIFHASSFHILLQTSFGLQIQVQHVPVMQVYVSLEQSYRAKTRGLCGNYNMVLSDDMKTPQGIVEGTAVPFSNSWKANLMCRDRAERLDDPCSLSVENERYAKHWCTLLLSSNNTFAQCRSVVDPEMYYKRCIYASCNCEKSEACLCAVFSSYARACASKGVFLTNWRDNVCEKYTRSCPASQTFSYKHQRCQLTCRSLGSKQQSCTSDFLPMDGCSCSEGLYLNEKGICVSMAKCPLSLSVTACPSPKEFFNCSAQATGELGNQCARTCLNLDNDDCVSYCESGCRCPKGLIEDGKDSCVKENECPCQHNGRLYAPGAQITNQCNNCTCKGGTWECTEIKCQGTCIIYGSGHYSTFDQQTYEFQGDCAYIAVKNNCGNKTVENNFGVTTENVKCGSTGTTCSKSVRIQLGRIEVKLAKGKYEVEDLGHGPEILYQIRTVGLYLVVESAIGLAVIWDRKTTVRIMLEPQHSGDVCGLCGDFDGDGQNDFTTQGQLVVSNPIEFSNSWKVSSSCPDVESNVDPCKVSPSRHHWAKMMCSIITGEKFKDCHNKVDSLPFYDNCVRDACACDTGGDCECLCTAVAAYAQACNEADVCVAWRTPDICPVFCDYYNSPGECKWHYNPCHTPCYKTCLNPEGICYNPLPCLEGKITAHSCYPVCPEDKPIFDEENQICVEECKGCFYNGTKYEENDIIYNVTDNYGMCYYAICKNTTVIFGNYTCSPTTPTTTLPTEPPTTTAGPTTTTKSTTLPTEPPTTTAGPNMTTKQSTTKSTTPQTTLTSASTTCNPMCEWSEWYDVHDATVDNSDWETYKNITDSGLTICKTPKEIECRATLYPEIDFDQFVEETGQVVTCNVGIGLICRKEDQRRRKCLNYEIRVCCEVDSCPTTSHSTPSTTPRPTTTTKSTTLPTEPPTTTAGPTTTTKSTTLPTEPPTTTAGPTTTTKSTTLPTEPPTTTAGPTTTTKSTTLPTEPPTTTAGPTTTEKSTTLPTEPPTTAAGPTTTTKSTTLPTKPPTTTAGPTTTEKSTTTPSKPPSTTAGPTTTTKSTTTPSIPTTTTQNETFFLCNCTMAKCIENNTIEIVPYECPPLEIITCTNGKKPVLVYDEYHCCQHYVCDCVCEGWGDPHYITFDGLFYSYQGNCTYVLMEEILPKHNLKIYIDNVFCDPTEDVSCPRSLIITYNSQAVALINHNLIGKIIIVNEFALKNGKRLKLPYSQDGVKIIDSGINLVLEIPRFNVVIMFGITGFTVTLPYQYFGKNTQGHCGTCTNNTSDDCMLPGGQLIESCAVMADYWPAKDIYQPSCEKPALLPTEKPEIINPEPCNPDSICNMLKSSVFAECHPYVSPDNFYRGCVFDSCHVSNPAVDCTSLQTYASACAQAGICLQWRNHTTLCSEPCLLFHSQFKSKRVFICKRQINHCCGAFFQVNEKFDYRCQNCICEESTRTVNCEPKVCPEPPKANCTGPGFVLVSQTNPSDSCCLAYTCRKTFSISAHFSSRVKFVAIFSLVLPPLSFCRYSEAAASMQHKCSCCKEMRYTIRSIDLHCLNGDVVPYNYIHVEECACDNTDCTKAAGKSPRRRRSFTLV